MGVVVIARGKASDLGLMFNEVNTAVTKPSMKLIAIHFAQRFIIVITQDMAVLLNA
jgi:hypothetical protein